MPDSSQLFGLMVFCAVIAFDYFITKKIEGEGIQTMA